MGKVAFLFPGQGSQYVGMGLDMYNESRRARSLFERADELLGFRLSDLCFHGPADELARTVNTQPAVLLVSVCCLELLRERGIEADAVAGHSLGEYSALVAAGVLSWEDALVIVRRRAEIMEEAFPGRKGGMAVILGLSDAAVEEICNKAARVGVVEPANYNCPGQVAISGEIRALEEALRLAEAAGARRTIRLNVSGPFHSSLMKPAAGRLEEVLADFDFCDPRIPVVANYTAKFVENVPDIKRNLCNQVAGSVQWSRSMITLKEYGIDTFVEVGPGRVLSGLMRRIDRSARTIVINGMDSLAKSAPQLRREREV